MKIQKNKCDECGKEHDDTETTLELRKVMQLHAPQIEREAPMPPLEPPISLFIYDFCDLSCLRNWCQKNHLNI